MSNSDADKLTLISHTLCPYVQRAAIALAEKHIEFTRVFIDLSDKPDWFKEMSPLGKVPLLQVGDEVIFESAVILEYIEDTSGHPLHPANALQRARHRSMIEYGSSILNSIAGFYSAGDKERFDKKITELDKRFSWLEGQLTGKIYFSGENFSLVDATFGPVFRYFDLFDQIGDFAILNNRPKISAWRTALAQRASVRHAVVVEYPELLQEFVQNRGSYLSQLLEKSRG